MTAPSARGSAGVRALRPGTTSDERPRRRRLTAGRVVGAVVVMLAAVVAGCGTAPSPSASTEAVPIPTGGPVVRAEATNGRYRLVLELSGITFAPNEPIEGRAWLEVVTGGAAELWASGSGLVLFQLREMDGTRGMGGATMDCRAYTVVGRSEPTGIVKAGGYSADDPDAAWYVAFFNDPLLRLPEGRWELAAWTDFTEGECGGPGVELRAPITITVEP